MASLHQHLRDCRHLLGDECENVNRWMDEYFAEYGPRHRFKRHHREGVREAEKIFGDLGRLAATVHILRDCRHIPRESDYVDGTVDNLGLLANWPVSAYIRYPDDAFERLAMFQMHGPDALLNLGFFRSNEDLIQILRMTRLASDPGGIQAAMRQWDEAAAARERLEDLQPAKDMPLTSEQEVYAGELQSQPLVQSIRQQFETAAIRLIDRASLINPLVWIDLEYIEELRAELADSDPASVIRFAIPTMVNVATQVAVDADGRGVSLVSSQKSVSALPPLVGQIPGIGMQVTFNVVGTPQLILASRVGGRLYLRNGIHRAFLLASSGVEFIPAVVVDERELSPILTAYPSFNMAILQLGRPPVITDMLNSELTLRVPMGRTKKVVRIRVEEMLLPVD